VRSKRSGHLRRSDRALQLSTRSRASREARRSIQKVNCFHREAERHSSRLNAPNEETALRVCGFMGSLVIPSAFANFELLLLRGRGSFPGPRCKFLPRTPAAPQPSWFRIRRRVPAGPRPAAPAAAQLVNLRSRTLLTNPKNMKVVRVFDPP
jgi:hypothetical protein